MIVWENNIVRQQRVFRLPSSSNSNEPHHFQTKQTFSIATVGGSHFLPCPSEGGGLLPTVDLLLL